MLWTADFIILLLLFAVGDAVKIQLSINAGKNNLMVDDGTGRSIKPIGTNFFSLIKLIILDWLMVY